MEISEPTIILGGRYRLGEQLGEGGMGQVYRAVDRLTQREVALKRVVANPFDFPVASTASSADPASEPRYALAQEFQALASLRHPNIIGVLNYGFDDDGYPYFAMELLENAQTILDAGISLPFPQQIDLLVQMLQALVYVHRRGIVHRDLKPHNVLVLPNHVVKVLDFGLSVKKEKAQGTVGTLAYMAPEILYGESATVRSDLFAFGVMAYEMLLGRHPFTDGKGGKSVLNYLARPAIYLGEVDLPDGVKQILEQLLRHEASERPENAGIILPYLTASLDQPIEIETSATRESFLQAAELVGRDDELAQLLDALDKAHAGRGSNWLIGGESGVGKTRLVDELRTRAMVTGALVLRGQASSDAGNLFQLWRPILRRMALFTELDDLAAGVLKAILPDLETILERPIPDAPILDAEATQTRMLNTVAGIFQQQTDCVVVILEDLQWAGEESIALLAWLNRLTHNKNLLVVGNFRDDERPDLPDKLPGMSLLPLERLSENQIAHLSVSMLGESGNDPHVLALLNRETEGNPFFLVEVVRALAEEAGQLAEIGNMTLPAHVFTGGLQQIVQRRLDQVPENGQPLLQIAAIAGRDLDLPLLRSLADNVDEWLTICVNAAVLEFRDGDWRFAHDKLRERVLTNINRNRTRQLHQSVATAIENAYPDDADQAGRLAFHWGEATQPDKEAYYATMAGDMALRSGANADAVTYFERVLALEKSLGGYDTPTKVEAIRKSGEAYLGLGRTKEGQARLEEALALYKLPVSHSWGQVLPDIVKQLVRQLGYRLFPTRIGRLEGARRDRHLAASNAYERLSQIYYFQNRVALFLRATLHSVNMAEKAGVSPEMGRGYANLSVATSNVPVHRWAEYYSQHARAVTNQVNDPNAKSWAFLLAGVYYSGIGAWDKAGTVLDESIDTAKQAGDARQWEMSMCVRGLGLRYRGRYEESLTYSKGCYPSSLSRGDLQAQSWALLGQLQNVIPLGRMGEVPALIQKLLPMLDENLEMDVKQDVRGQLADAYLRLGDRGKAFALVQAAAPIMAQQRMPANFYLLAGYTGISQTIFTLWDEAIAVGSTDQAQLVQLAEQAVQGWKFFARVFPVGKPAYYIVRGQLARRLGQVEKARGFLQEGMENAGILQMPLEAKLAQQEIEKLQVS